MPYSMMKVSEMKSLLLTGQVTFWLGKEESCWEFCVFQYSVPRDL